MSMVMSKAMSMVITDLNRERRMVLAVKQLLFVGVHPQSYKELHRQLKLIEEQYDNDGVEK